MIMRFSPDMEFPAICMIADARSSVKAFAGVVPSADVARSKKGLVGQGRISRLRLDAED
ncbi:MAG TPA: hypothetical protein VF263_17875 [Longimicrobiaceae bacterium]